MASREITADKAPRAIGPYSQGMAFDKLVFTSGQIPIDPSTGDIVEGGLSEQVHQVMKNLKAILEAAGSSMDKVIKTTIFTMDLGHFNEINSIYSGYFNGKYPCRSCVQVAALPKNALIEIEAVAIG